VPETFRALVLEDGDPAPRAEIRSLSDADLPDGDVTVSVTHSDLNYKDGMVIKGLGRLVRRYPHVPGIDFAGTVVDSADDRFRPGDAVLLTGWRVGEAHWGGYAERARVRADWLTPIPDGLDGRTVMAVGTAGLTAGLALMALEDHGLTPEVEGDLLITGAAGGLGSVAVALAAASGYRVTAATGRPETHDYLRALGATDFVDRAELSEGRIRPLDSERWAGCIDSVGSTTLAKVLSQTRYGRSVAACGLAGGSDLPATVVPFLLRGVNLLGIDSVMCPPDRRGAAWARIARDLPLDRLDAITEVVPLEAVVGLADDILAGKVRGRIVVDTRA